MKMFNEKLQNQEFSAATNVLAKQYLDLLTQEASLSSVAQPSMPMRQAPNVFTRASSKKPHLATLVETAQRNFLNAIIAVGNLETLEEKVRSRAFSEGAAALPIESIGSDQQAQSTSTSRYKTELCRPFEENGKCKYGEKCQFAHGKHELRHMVRHPKYKTELCRTYHTNGWCNYGARCHFIHDQNEMSLENQRQAGGINTLAAQQIQTNTIAIDQRQNKSGNLQLTSQQRVANRLNSYPLSTLQMNSPVEQSPTFFEGFDIGPISPIGSNSFNYPMVPIDTQRAPFIDITNNGLDNRQGSPPLFNNFDFKINHLSDDSAFGSLSPPDSDRESSTGSPPGFGSVAPVNLGCQQRLPIFRCLSQS